MPVKEYVFALGTFMPPSPQVTITDREELERLFGGDASYPLPLTLFGSLAEHALAERRNVPPEHRPESVGALYHPGSEQAAGRRGGDAHAVPTGPARHAVRPTPPSWPRQKEAQMSKETSARVSSIAGKILAGALATRSEARILAASALIQHEPDARRATKRKPKRAPRKSKAGGK